MNASLISVPEYVAKSLNKAQASEFGSEVFSSLAERIYTTISLALTNNNAIHWSVANDRYASRPCIEPYGFHIIDGHAYIYAEERGQKTPVAIFRDAFAGADYFVWIVSSGLVSIDWDKFASDSRKMP